MRATLRHRSRKPESLYYYKGWQYSNASAKSVALRRNRRTCIRPVPSKALIRRKSAQIYSIALRNSNPKNRISPAAVLSQNPRSDRGRFAGDNAGGGRRGSGNGQMDDLISSKRIGRGDTGAGRADIQSFGEFDEVGARSVGARRKTGTCRRRRDDRRVEDGSKL